MTTPTMGVVGKFKQIQQLLSAMSAKRCEVRRSSANMAATDLDSMEDLAEGGDDLNLFEACKNGDLERVASLLTPESVNSRDVAGRKSTPLHFAAGIVIGSLVMLVGNSLSLGISVVPNHKPMEFLW